MTTTQTNSQVEGAGAEACPDGLRPVPGFPDYFVSRSGVVHSRRPKLFSSPAVMRRLKPRPNGSGYLMVTLCRGRAKHQSSMIHRLVAQAFLPPPPEGVNTVRHKDGNKFNNYVDNLAWGTVAENLADRWAHGTMTCGVRNGAAKIDAAIVADIRERSNRGEQYRDIGKIHGISGSQAQRVATGERWAHADGKAPRRRAVRCDAIRRQNRAAAAPVPCGGL